MKMITMMMDDELDEDDNDNEPENNDDEKDNGQDDEEPEHTVRRSTRERRAVDRMNLNQREEKDDFTGVAQEIRDSWNNADTDQKIYDEVLEYCHNLISQAGPDPDNDHMEYDTDQAPLIARLMTDLHEKYTMFDESYGQQFLLNDGLKKFGEKGRACTKELDQMYRRSCFTPIDIATLTPSEKKKAQVGLMFVTEKKDGTVKGRLVYNGKPTRIWYDREETASPTVMLESIMLTY